MEAPQATQQSPLVQLVSTSGLAETKQNLISATLGVFFEKAAEWDATIQSIVITSPEETGKMKMAREGRLTLRRMRLEAEKIVKDKRAAVKSAMADFTLEDKLWLKAGQMMEATFENLETKLEEKEKFAERWEAEEKGKRTASRLLLLSEYSDNDQLTDRAIIENMADDVFDSYLATSKKMKEDRIAAERKAEEERIAREAAEAAERARIAAENARLKAEAEEREKVLAAERAKAEAERKALEQQAAKAKAEADAELKAQAEANAKLQAELRAKAEAEDKARKQAEQEARETAARIAAEAKAKQQAVAKAARAPRVQKLTAWIDDLKITAPPDMDADPTVVEINEKFESFKRWAKKEIQLSAALEEVGV